MSNNDDIDELDACVLTHAPDARLIGNVRAVDIHAILNELRALRKLREAASLMDQAYLFSEYDSDFADAFVKALRDSDFADAFVKALREAQQHGGNDG